MHLLRLRYSLAEKIYFHHAKIVLSAMIIEAVHAAKLLCQDEFDEKSLCNMRLGDNELLLKLKECKAAIANKMVQKITERSLYQPIYMLPYSQPGLDDVSSEKKTQIVERFRSNALERFQLARQLEKWNKLPEGSVIIYCPTQDMNLKQVEALCLWRNKEIMRLVDIPGERLAVEAKQINTAHRELWKLYVLMERNLPGELEKKNNLASDCYHEFGLPNAIETFSKVGMDKYERYIEEWAQEHQTRKVTVSEKKQLITMRSISSETSIKEPPANDDLLQRLNDLRK